MSTSEGGFAERMARIESLVGRAERFADPAAREVARELTAALLEMHGAGFARVLDALATAGEPGRQLVRTLTTDPIVASLLLLHGLHPIDLETRVRSALDALRPALESQGAAVELLGTENGVIRLRIEAKTGGVRAALLAALDEAAPDRAGLEMIGEPPTARLVPLPLLG